MKFDIKQRLISISVRELASIVKNGGNSNYVSARLRTKIGQKVHQKYQQNVMSSGKTEFFVKFEFNVDKWTFLVRGKIDVFYKEDDKVILEEIKSITQENEEIDPAYIKQLQLYMHYFNRYQDVKAIQAYLVQIDSKDRIQNRLEIKIEDQEDFLNSQGKRIIESITRIVKKKKISSKRSEALIFPFTKYRKNQKDIISEIDNCLVDENRAVLSAPAGLGKTLSTLYPALKYALKYNLRLYVATSKTTQQLIYWDTLKTMISQKADFTTVLLTAKSKMCHTDEFNCEGDVCKYQDNYEISMVENLVSDLIKFKVVETERIKRVAHAYKICPFELSMDVALNCDVVVGDLNYIFHPKIKLQRYLHYYSKETILIVDEAHNLVPRVNEFYSPKLSILEVKRIVDFIDNSYISSRIKRHGRTILMKLYRYIQSLKDQILDFESADHALIEIDIEHVSKLQEQFDEFTIDYIDELISDSCGPDKLVKDDLIYFSDNFNYFSTILKESKADEFSQIYDSDISTMRILCKSSKNKLKTIFKNFNNVLLQSATIAPFEYYRNIMGLPNSTEYLDYPSPFPKKNQLYLIYPNISTKYKERDHHSSDVVEVITTVIQAKPGNYLAFFPSFAYLDRIRSELQDHEINLIIQSSSMSTIERKDVLEKLKSKNTNYLVLAVMGGIFSEGVDYPGKMAIGAFIFGPGLPSYNFDRELIKEYFQSEFNKGFDYAYRNPGITKVIQSAGRIFRTPRDRGTVILIGKRFTTPYYKSELPKYWDVKITENPVDEINKFWYS